MRPKCKEGAMEACGMSGTDTAAAEVRIAGVLERVVSRMGQVKTNAGGYQSGSGVLMPVREGRQLLDYLRNIEESRYQNIIKRLGIRR